MIIFISIKNFLLKYILVRDYPPNICINSGMNTCDGKITNVAILTARFVPITTSKTLKILLFHKSLKPSKCAKFLMSLCLTFLYFASVNPENHPAARSGWIIVNGATNPPTIADWIFDPDNIEPKNPISILIPINW